MHLAASQCFKHIVHRGMLAVILLIHASAIAITAQPVKTVADAAFQELTEAWWEDTLARDPIFASGTGDTRYNDQLPTVSLTAAMSHQRKLTSFQTALAEIDVQSLSKENQINFAFVRRAIQDELAEYEFQMHLIPITNREGFHISFPDLQATVPFDTVEDYENFIHRLRMFRGLALGNIQVMRKGIEEGMTLPSVVLQQYRAPIETHIVKDVTKSVFYEPFKSMSPSIDEEDRVRLQAEAASAIKAGIIPGYQAFLDFMENEYVPAARGSLGASALPRGREFYQHRVRRFTTLEITPEEVHEIGQSEVRRIQTEMKEIIAEVGFEGNIRSFADHLRSDPKFQPKSADELLQRTAVVLKNMDGRLPLLFHTLPRTPYGIKKIPDYIAPQTTTAYYMPPPGDLSRAGFYYLNTYDLKSRPLYGIEALSLHEAVPGHHLQLALQTELTDLPPYRRFKMFTVFVEGWALYAERLGLEVGFYEDPYSDFGRLTYEMWRACRLVVDTGIHYLGWSREEAIEFMENNTALSAHNIRAEVDRYIAWPGQALAYKMGELRIRQLREQAETQLGDAFDIRRFHDVVLRNGSVPLDILDQAITDWINEQSE